MPVRYFCNSRYQLAENNVVYKKTSEIRQKAQYPLQFNLRELLLERGKQSFRFS